MKITDPKKFEKAVRILGNYCKRNKRKTYKAPYHEVIYYSDNKLYSTEGHIMAVFDVSDCISDPGCADFIFPREVIAKNTIELDAENRLFIDGKQIDIEQIKAVFYKEVFSLLQHPVAELTLDFSEYKNLDVGYNKELAFVKISKEEVIFDYKDETETTCTIQDCFSNNLLDNDYGDFKPVKFPMWQILQLMKISKKFKIQQYEKIDGAYKIFINSWEFLIMPSK